MTTRNTFSIGDHLIVQRTLLSHGIFTHHGVYIGKKKVIHKTLTGGVKIVSIKEFQDYSKKIMIRKNDSNLTQEEIKENIKNNIATTYNLFTRNCEHYATLLTTGEARSTQVEFYTNIPTRVSEFFSDKYTTISELASETLTSILPQEKVIYQRAYTSAI